MCIYKASGASTANLLFVWWSVCVCVVNTCLINRHVGCENINCFLFDTSCILGQQKTKQTNKQTNKHLRWSWDVVCFCMHLILFRNGCTVLCEKVCPPQTFSWSTNYQILCPLKQKDMGHTCYCSRCACCTLKFRLFILLSSIGNFCPMPEDTFFPLR